MEAAMSELSLALFTAFTRKNTTSAMMRKLMHAEMNAPKSISVPGTTNAPVMSVPPPVMKVMNGLMMFPVSAVTMPMAWPNTSAL